MDRREGPRPQPEGEERGRRGRGGKRLELLAWALFRLKFQKPPAASSGKEYATVDERCAACVIYGGEEEPCLTPHFLQEIERDTGRPCPRADLTSSDNAMAAHVFMLSVSEHTRHLCAAILDEAPPDERPRIAARAGSVLRDPEVVATLWPRPERAGS